MTFSFPSPNVAVCVFKLTYPYRVPMEWPSPRIGRPSLPIRARASTLAFLRTGSPLCLPGHLNFFGRGYLLGFTQEESNKLISFFLQYFRDGFQCGRIGIRQWNLLSSYPY